MLQTYPYPALLPPPIGGRALTQTELEIIKISYLPDKIIADSMNISYYTVTTHMQNIRRKTGLKGKNEMNRYCKEILKGYNNERDKVN